jgi:hypothetical protein
MSRLTLPALLLLAACGAAMDNTWRGGEVDQNVDAWYLGYPETADTVLASAIAAEANGFSMGLDRATVVMQDMTCGIKIDSGTVFFDLALRVGEIQDGTDDPELRLTSLLVAPPLVHVLPVDSPALSDDYLVRGVRQARVTDGDGFVALRLDDETGNCEVRWYDDGHLADATTLGADFVCDGDLDLEVDPGQRGVWVAGPSGVWSVSPDSTRALGVSGDLIAWDDADGLLYVATRGETRVRALDMGGERWSLELPGAVADLESGGAVGGLVVANEVGFGAEVVRLASDGSEIDTLTFDQPVFDIEVSHGGGMLGVGRAYDHGYYRLR